MRYHTLNNKLKILIKSALLVIGLGVTLTACVTSNTANNQTSEEKISASEINARLGIEYLRAGKLRLAQEKLERAVEYDSKSPLANAYLAVLYEELGESQKAGRHYRSAVNHGADQPNINNMYGSYLCREGQFKKAEKYFLVAAENPFSETREVPYSSAGVCLMNIPDYQTAEVYLRKALEFEPDYDQALFHLAKLNYEVNLELQGRAFVERYLANNPDDPSALLLAYQIERRLGDWQAANRYSARLKREFPTSEQTRDLIIAERDSTSGGSGH
ncbi:MAG: type IV pilus biogenesis/stability protein PilW [Gammaproteobacteria bacterium]|nr:type IV pilus biogenesis/stability protein PilW [Gammaproteobacteria bacterium]